VFFVTRYILAKPPEEPPYELCGTGKACKPPLVCSSVGKCIPENTCVVSSDCPDGNVCIKGECFTERCTDERCGPNGKCVDGLCKAKCNSSTECPGSQGCVNNICVSRHCLYSGDCFVDEACVGLEAPVYGIPPNIFLLKPSKSGVCEKALNSCFTNKDCSPGLVCSPDKVCIQCVSDANCSGNQVCIKGVCSAPTLGCPPKTKLIIPCDGVKCPIYPVCCPTGCGSVCKEDSKLDPCPFCVNGLSVCKPLPEIDLRDACSTKERYCGICVNGACSLFFGEYGDRCTRDMDCLGALQCTKAEGEISFCLPSK